MSSLPANTTRTAGVTTTSATRSPASRPKGDRGNTGTNATVANNRQRGESSAEGLPLPHSHNTTAPTTTTGTHHHHSSGPKRTRSVDGSASRNDDDEEMMGGTVGGGGRKGQRKDDAAMIAAALAGAFTTEVPRSDRRSTPRLQPQPQSQQHQRGMLSLVGDLADKVRNDLVVTRGATSGAEDGSSGPLNTARHHQHAPTIDGDDDTTHHGGLSSPTAGGAIGGTSSTNISTQPNSASASQPRRTHQPYGAGTPTNGGGGGQGSGTYTPSSRAPPSFVYEATFSSNGGGGGSLSASGRGAYPNPHAGAPLPPPLYGGEERTTHQHQQGNTGNGSSGPYRSAPMTSGFGGYPSGQYRPQGGGGGSFSNNRARPQPFPNSSGNVGYRGYQQGSNSYGSNGDTYGYDRYHGNGGMRAGWQPRPSEAHAVWEHNGGGANNDDGIFHSSGYGAINGRGGPRGPQPPSYNHHSGHQFPSFEAFTALDDPFTSDDEPMGNDAYGVAGSENGVSADTGNRAADDNAAEGNTGTSPDTTAQQQQILLLKQAKASARAKRHQMREYYGQRLTAMANHLDGMAEQHGALSDEAEISRRSCGELERLYGKKCGDVIRLQAQLQHALEQLERYEHQHNHHVANTGGSSGHRHVGGGGVDEDGRGLQAPPMGRGHEGDDAHLLHHSRRGDVNQSPAPQGSDASPSQASAAAINPPPLPTTTAAGATHHEEITPRLSSQTPSQSQPRHLAASGALVVGGGSQAPSPPTAGAAIPAAAAAQTTTSTSHHPVPWAGSGVTAVVVHPTQAKRYYCEVCNVLVNSEVSLKAHLEGDKHRKGQFRLQYRALGGGAGGGVGVPNVGGSSGGALASDASDASFAAASSTVATPNVPTAPTSA